jgi:hypothetical protein
MNKPMIAKFNCVRDDVRLLGSWNEKGASGLEPESVERLTLNSRLGWEPRGGLEFIKAFSNAKILRIVCFQKLDLAPILQLTELRMLDLELYPNFKYPFDFHQMSNLESLSVHWNQGFQGIQGMKSIRRLIIKEIYGVKVLDLSGLKQLKTLQLIGGRGVRSLAMAGSCALESLRLEGLPNLQAIEGFCAGHTVRELNLSSVSRVPASFWKQFAVLERVESTMKEPITEKSFACPPKTFLRWPA